MNTKRLLTSWRFSLTVLIIAINVIIPAAFATDDGKHTESIETILQKILAKQNVDTVQNLNCSKISDEDFEHIGDAFMERQHPGEAHEAMDRMMGGEGSETLRQAHIQMGKNYLGCSQDGWGMGMMPMMWMMGSPPVGGSPQVGGGGSPMMGWNYGGMMNWGAGWSIVGSLFFILVLIDLILLGIWLWKQIQKR